MSTFFQNELKAWNLSSKCSLQEFLLFFKEHQIKEIDPLFFILKKHISIGGSLTSTFQMVLQNLQNSLNQHRFIKPHLERLMIQYYLFFLLGLSFLLFALIQNSEATFPYLKSTIGFTLFLSWVAAQLGHYLLFNLIKKKCLYPPALAPLYKTIDLLQRIKVICQAGSPLSEVLELNYKLLKESPYQAWQHAVYLHIDTKLTTERGFLFKGNLFTPKLPAHAPMFTQLLTNLLTIHWEQGTSITSPLENLSLAIQNCIKEYQRQYFSRIPILFMLYQLLFLFPLTFMLILGPYLFHFYDLLN